MNVKSEWPQRLSAAPARPEKRRSLLHSLWKARKAYAFLLPIFICLAVFKYGPFVSALFKSLYEWNGANVDRFAGLANFRAMLGDHSLHTSLVNAVCLTLGALAAHLTLPLLAAVLVFHVASKRVSGILRVLFIVPMVVPGIVVIRIWSWIYEQGGVLNQLLKLFGLGAWSHAWLGEKSTVIGAMIFYNFPWIGGIYFLIYLAGLMAISPELFEAGSMDGMGRWSRFWRLELPLLRSQIKLVVMLTVIHQIQNFELPLVLTNGGPGDASLTPALHLYNRAFTHNELGYASAVGVMLFLVILLLTVVNNRLLKSTDKLD